MLELYLSSPIWQGGARFFKQLLSLLWRTEYLTILMTFKSKREQKEPYYYFEYWTNDHIFIVIITMFRPICSLTFFMCFMSNSRVNAESRTEPFILTTGIDCSKSVKYGTFKWIKHYTASLTDTHAPTNTQESTLSLTHRHSLTYEDTHKDTHIQTSTSTHARTHSHSVTQSNTNTRLLTLTPTHRQKRTHIYVYS